VQGEDKKNERRRRRRRRRRRKNFDPRRQDARPCFG